MLTNKQELDQFIVDNKVDIEKSNLKKQLDGFGQLPDLELALKNGMMIFLVCIVDYPPGITMKNFVVKMTMKDQIMPGKV